MIDYYCDLFSFVFCLFVCLSLTNERISLIVDLFLLLSRHCCCISFLPSLMVIVRSFVFFFSLFVPLASCFKCSKKKWKKENCNKNNNNNTKKKKKQKKKKNILSLNLAHITKWCCLLFLCSMLLLLLWLCFFSHCYLFTWVYVNVCTYFCCDEAETSWVATRRFHLSSVSFQTQNG